VTRRSLMGGAAPTELGRQLFGLGKSARISRNSFGPRISVRLRCCRSGSGSDWLSSFSSSRAASFDALRAASLFGGRLAPLPARAFSSSRRIASGRVAEKGPLQPRLSYACARLMNLEPKGVCNNWFRASLPALLASSQEAN